MENSKNQSNIINNQELMTLSELSNNNTNVLLFKDNYLPQRLRKKSRQLSSKSIKATIKYEYTISKNNTIRENQTKNENDLKHLSLSNGTMLRAQSRILNNKLDDCLMVKNEYTYRNRGFENFNMNKVCGSSYRKHKKNKNEIHFSNSKNSIIPEQLDKNNSKGNIKVIKEYMINYDNKIFNENDINMKINKENININKNINKIERKRNNKNDNNPNKNKSVNTERKFILSKRDYYTDKNEKEKKIKFYIDKTNNIEIKSIRDKELEIFSKKKSTYDKHNNIKYLIEQKENIPFNISFNIKQKLINTRKKDIFIPKNKNTSNIFSYKMNHSKKNKYPEENSKTTYKLGFNKKFDSFNGISFQNSRKNINKNVNNIKMYNILANQMKKNVFGDKQCLNNRTISIIKRNKNYENEKCIMPPNNLKNILFEKEKEYFDLFPF